MKHYSFVFFKPDALERNLIENMVGRFREEGLAIEFVGYQTVTEELMFAHYCEVIETLGDGFREKVRKAFRGKSVIPLILSAEDEHIIERVRKIVGATDPAAAEQGTLRGDYGRDRLETAMAENRMVNNLIHASDSREAFIREVRLWFGNKAEAFLV
ncbi:MAG: hypothetical protein BGN88_15495 [Clostridiales bacterium 43-6]|nr:MAG: hypothetical protein BGN88_15495 [Clostridiales bacterium 43-6]